MGMYTAVMLSNSRSRRVTLNDINRTHKPTVLSGYIEEGVYVKTGPYCPIYYEDRITRTELVVAQGHVRTKKNVRYL